MGLPVLRGLDELEDIDPAYADRAPVRILEKAVQAVPELAVQAVAGTEHRGIGIPREDLAVAKPGNLTLIDLS
jgi:hypothetical protein